MPSYFYAPYCYAPCFPPPDLFLPWPPVAPQWFPNPNPYPSVPVFAPFQQTNTAPIPASSAFGTGTTGDPLDVRATYTGEAFAHGPQRLTPGEITSDSAANVHVIATKDLGFVNDIQPLGFGQSKPCEVADGRIIHATHSCMLRMGIPDSARLAYIYPDATESLLSTPRLCDAGMTVHYTMDAVTVCAPSNGNSLPCGIVIKGTRTKHLRCNLWVVNMQECMDLQSIAMRDTVQAFKVRGYQNRITNLSDREHVAFVHALVGSPVPALFLDAVDRLNFPGLTREMVLRNPPHDVATPTGHLKQSPSGYRTTKPPPPERSKTPVPTTPAPTLAASLADITAPFKIAGDTIVALNVTLTEFERLYGDSTGNMLLPSIEGYNSILIVYHPSTGYISFTPLKKKSDLDGAYKKALDFFESKGRHPTWIAADNEMSAETQRFFRSHGVVVQLAPPGNHRANLAERIIQIAKDHIVSCLARTDPKFPLKYWYRCVRQMEVTLNLLRACPYDRSISCFQALYGRGWDWNAHPMSKIGTLCMIHQKPDSRKSFGARAEQAFYTGPAEFHYRCWKFTPTATGRARVSDTVEWFPTDIKMPGSDPMSRLTAGIQHVAEALQDLAVSNPAITAITTTTQASHADLLAHLGDIYGTRTVPAIAPASQPNAPNVAVAPQVEGAPAVEGAHHAEGAHQADIPPAIVGGSQSEGAPAIAVEPTFASTSPRARAPYKKKGPRRNGPPATPPAAAPIPAPATAVVRLRIARKPSIPHPPRAAVPAGLTPTAPVVLPVVAAPAARPPPTTAAPAARRTKPAQSTMPAVIPQAIPPTPVATGFNVPRRSQRSSKGKHSARRATHYARRSARRATQFNAPVQHPDAYRNALHVCLDLLNTGVPESAKAFKARLQDAATGRDLSYKQACAGPDGDKWTSAYATEIRTRVSQGCYGFINAVPAGRRASRLRKVLEINKAHQPRVRGTLDGSTHDVSYEAFAINARNAHMVDRKIFLNAALSEGLNLSTGDLKDFFPNPRHRLTTPAYIKILKSELPAETIAEFNLDQYKGNYVYLEVFTALYGLPESGTIAQDSLVELLAQHGYIEEERHEKLMLFRSTDPTNLTCFSLHTDDFLLAWKDRAHAEHLVKILTDAGYIIKVDWEAQKYCNWTIDYKMNDYLRISQPEYVPTLLAAMGLSEVPLQKSAMAEPFYVRGKHTPMTSPDMSASLDPTRVKLLERILGSSLYLAICTRPDIATAVNMFLSELPVATDLTWTKVMHLMGYLRRHPERGIEYLPSDMVLVIYSDSNFDSPKSRTGGVHFLGRIDDPTFINGPIHCISTKQSITAACVAEAEYIGTFDNGKVGLPFRHYLHARGYPQPATLLFCDNKCAVGISNDDVKMKRSKYFDIKWHWIRDRVRTGHYDVRWTTTASNIADFFTKILSVADHIRFMLILTFGPRDSDSSSWQ